MATLGQTSAGTSEKNRDSTLACPDNLDIEGNANNLEATVSVSRERHESRSSVQSNFPAVESNLQRSVNRDFTDEHVPPEPANKKTSANRIFNHILVLLSISFWAYVGVIIRFYLEKLAPYTSFEIFSAFWAEFIGSFIMAFVVNHSKVLQKHGNTLYIGLGTGLCGSITTFSSWMQEAASVLIVWEGVNPLIQSDAASRIFSWLTIIIAGFSVSLCGLFSGTHFCHLSPWSNLQERSWELVPIYGRCPRLFTILLFALGTFLVILLPLLLDEQKLLFSCVFAPFGAISRFYLSKALNKPKRKYGTFAANIGGSTILAVLTVIPIAVTIVDSVVHNLIGGIATGYCGCLTTVSTFVVELSTLKWKTAYVYGFLSVITAQIMFVLIVGIYTWTT